MTLLSAKENPESIFKECRGLGMQTYHIEINGANAALLSEKKTIGVIRSNLKHLHQLMCNEELRVLIHCAAGIHRTGTLTYSLLRMDGKTP